MALAAQPRDDLRGRPLGLVAPVRTGRSAVRQGPLATRARRRASLLALLSASAALYSVGLSSSGWANAYYSAAAQAGARSWRAMLFGGLDPSGGVSVDKPPAALWLMDLSVRAFGLSPWAVLLPQAVCGVAAVGLLYATVRRQALSLDAAPAAGRWGSARAQGAAESGREARAAAAGLLAGAALALTPVATLMARYNNPDELMLLLLVAAAYALMRSVGAARGGGAWLAACGALLGLAFLAKMLQAWLVLPAFLAVALVAGAGSLGRRLGRCAVAGIAMAAAAGWWILLVQTTPPGQRPWVGGTRHDSVLELALGYNGFGRLTGQEAAGGATNTPRPGTVLRFAGAWAPEVSWLLPAAVLALAAGWLLTRGRGRRDPLRAGLLLWGVWLTVLVPVLGSLHGIAHGYYTLQLAPAIAGAAALGGAVLWRTAWAPRGPRWAAWLLELGVTGNAVWITLVTARRPSWPLIVVPSVLGLAAVSVLGLLVALRTRGGSPAGPAPGALVLHRRRGAARAVVLVATVLGVLLCPAAWSLATAQAVHRGPNVASGPGPASIRTPRDVVPGSAPGDGLGRAVVSTVRSGAPGFAWAAAVVGWHAADLQLASDSPVWALGGYSGHDPHPGLRAFLLAADHHRVHYLVFSARDLRAPGDAGRIVRWAVSCLPVQQLKNVLTVDLTDVGTPAQHCALPRGAARHRG